MSPTFSPSHEKAMLYGAGVPDRESMKNSPQVGIATVWWEGNPCNMHLLDLGKTVKKEITDQGMLGWQYNTIGVSDAISMGSEGGFLFHFVDLYFLLSPTHHIHFMFTK